MAASDTSFGYLLPTRELVMAKSPPDIGQAIELAESAEELLGWRSETGGLQDVVKIEENPWAPEGLLFGGDAGHSVAMP